MKILWLVNIIMPELAVHLGRKPSVFGGWLTGAMNAVREAGHELVICATENRLDVQCCDVSGVRYYIAPNGSVEEMEAHFRAILQREMPDVVHIYGTEFEQCWAMSLVSDPAKTVVQIQGALTYIKDFAYAGLPEKLCRDNLIHKLLRKLRRGGESIELQKRLFEHRAELEQKTLKRAKYALGASNWGNVVARSINPEIRTFDCNLILRDSFYTDERWDADRCEKHSIYILFSYPVKGFHKFLDALPMILHEFPDTQVYVVANKLPWRNYHGLKEIIQNVAPDYNWLIQKQIERLNLKEYIHFLGHLSEEQVKHYLLQSNVFVSASAIENQCTSLGEAMILGLPSVASCVGAMLEMIDHGEDGFLYPFSEPYLLADAVCRIFDNPALARQFSEKGHAHAAKTYDCKANCRSLLNMYEKIQKNAEEQSE